MLEVVVRPQHKTPLHISVTVGVEERQTLTPHYFFFSLILFSLSLTLSFFLFFSLSFSHLSFSFFVSFSLTLSFFPSLSLLLSLPPSLSLHPAPSLCLSLLCVGGEPSCGAHSF